MHGFTERLFRYVFFYFGCYAALLGVFSVIAAPSYWYDAVYRYQAKDSFFLLIFTSLVFGSMPLFGCVLLSRFRRLASWAILQIPNPDRYGQSGLPPENRWYDVGPFCTLCSISFGLFFLTRGIWSMQSSWYHAGAYLAVNEMNFDSLSAVFVSYRGISLFVPLVSLGAGIFLVVYSARFSAYVAKKILSEDDPDLEEEKARKEPHA